ncbi:MAG: cadherin-like domain-containing protein [Planctomycetes bacterium]|nr:cadherin-like domain-containing protein [Planctomycetota bacterium]
MSARVLVSAILLIAGLSLSGCPQGDGPKATPDAYSTPANTVLNVDVRHGLLANDRGSDLKCTAETLATVQGGSVQIFPQGDFIYTPPTDFIGDDAFVYHVKNGNGESTGFAGVVVFAVRPDARDDAYVGAMGATLTVAAATGVLANDSLLGATIVSPATGTAVATSAGGTLTLDADGSFVYMPPSPTFFGLDDFTYVLSNTAGNDAATVVIDIHKPAVANDDNYSTPAGVTLNVPSGASDLTANDVAGFPIATLTTFGGGNLGGAVTDHAAGATATFAGGGSVTVNANGSFDFVPGTFTGVFTFSYRLQNIDGFSDALVTIGVPEAPTAVDDPNYRAATGALITIDAASGLVPNDDLGYPVATITSFGGGDAGGSVTSFSAGGTANFGSGHLQVNADGSFEFQSDAAFTGFFTFQYRLSNSEGTSDATATVEVQLAPVVTDDSYVTLRNQAISRTPADADDLLDNDISVPATSVLTFGGGSLGGNVADNSAGATVGIGTGSLTVLANGGFTFTPDNNYIGDFTFDYRITNGFGTDEGTVTISVQLAPTAAADASYLAVEGMTLSIDAASGLLGNDIVGHPPSTLVSFGGGTLGGTVTTYGFGSAAPFTTGTLTVNADGSFVFDATTFTGLFTFDYRISNVQGTSDATVTIDVRRLPAAVADLYQGAPGVTVSRLTSDPDDILDNDTLGVPAATLTHFGAGSLTGAVTDNVAGATITPIPGYTNGSLTVNADGSFTFVPGTLPTMQTGIFTFEYRLTNSVGTSDELVTIALEVAPAFTSANNDTFAVGTSDTANIAATGVPQTMTITITSGTLPASLTFSDNGDGTATISGTAANGDEGAHVIELTANNGVAPNAVQTFTLTITRGPVANDDNPGALYTLVLGGTLTRPAGDLFVDHGAGADIRGFPLATVASFGPSTGTETTAGSAGSTSGGTGLTVNADGSFSYTPVATGVHTFVYTLTNVIGSDTATVTITVNQGPTANNDNPGALYTLVLGGTLTRPTGDLFVDHGAGADVRGFPLATVASFGPSTGAETAAGRAGSTSGGTGLTVNADGSFSYTPVANGVHTFVYTLTNSTGSDTATVTITVNELPTVSADPTGGIPSNSTPPAGANPHPYHIAINTSISSGSSPDLIANDNRGFPLADVVSFGPTTGSETTVASATNGVSAGGGVIRVFANGTFNYAPPSATFTGIDTFTYRLQNAGGTSGAATVSIAVGIRPAGVNDTYAPVLIGNCAINTDTSTDFTVLTNDTGDQRTAALVSATNGNATVASDGKFTFNPAPGYEGTATITYSVNNGFGAGATNGVVTLTVSGMIWFADDSGAAGDGRNSTPFNSIAGVSNIASGGLYIFLYSGTYSSGLNLNGNNKLIGQGATASLATITGFTIPADMTPALPATGGANPVINGQLDIGTATTIRGFTLGTFNGLSLDGTGPIGSLNVSEVVINNGDAAGRAMHLIGPALTGSFTSVTAGGGGRIVQLRQCTGSLTIGAGGTVTGGGSPAVPCIEIDGGSLNLTFEGNASVSLPGRPLLEVMGAHSGTLTFQTGTLTDTGGDGLNFISGGGTYNFNGTVNLSSGGNAIHIAGGLSGTFSFGSGVSISNPGGKGLYVANGSVTITYAGSIAHSSANKALDLNSAATSSITGNITCTGSSTGIFINAISTGTHTLSGNLSLSGSSAANIFITNCSGGTINLSGASKTLSSTTNNAVTTTNNTGGTINFTGGGLAITTTSGEAFLATGGGTITVQGTGNTITTGSGTCVDIQNTNAGASGITFDSCISTSGQIANITTSTGTKTLGRIATSSGATTSLNLITAGTVNVGSTTATRSAVTSTGYGIAISATVLSLDGAGNDGLDCSAPGGIGVYVIGGTVDILGGNLSISAGSGQGLGSIVASTLTIQGTGNTITTTTGTCVSLSNNCNAGAAGITFDSVTSTSGQVASITTSTGTKTLGRISTSSGATTALNLSSAGTVNVGDTVAPLAASSLTTSTAACIQINTTTLVLNGTGAGAGLSVSTTDVGAGIAVSGGGAVDISGGGLVTSCTGGGTGLTGSAGAGLLTITGSGNTITTATGGCIVINGRNIGAAGINFESCISTSGQVAFLLNTTGAKTLGRVSTSSGVTTALSLLNAGSVNVGSTTGVKSSVTTSSATALLLNTTTLSLDGPGSADGLDITTTGSGFGVDCQGGTVSITGGELDITTTFGVAFLGGAGTVDVQGAGNTITTGSATCVSMSSCNAGVSGITFDSCISTSGAVASIATSTGTKTLGRVSTSSGATTALSLTNAGSVNVGSTTGVKSAVTTTSATALLLNTTTLSLDGPGSADGLDITTTNGYGVECQGGTVSITGGELDITCTNNGIGFVAGAGTVDVQGTGNTITTTFLGCVDIQTCNAGASGITFASCVSGSGRVLNVVTSTGTKTFGFVQTGGGSGASMNLVSAGTVNIGSPTATRSNITGGSGCLTIEATTLSLDGPGAGNDGLTVNGGGANGAVYITGTGTVSISGGPLVINSGANPGVRSDTAATLNISGSSNTITTTTGNPIQLVNCGSGTGINFFSCISGSGVFILTNSPGTKTLGRIATSSGSTTSLQFSNAGTVNVGSTDASTKSAVATNGGAAVSLSSTVLQLAGTGAATGLNVTTVSSGNGVNISGGTVSITGGNLVINTTGSSGTGTGFSATSGTVDVQGAGNTITSGAATALNIVGATVGASHMTFESVSADGGTTSGILIQNTTGSTGTVFVTGTGTTAGSGGTIQNKTGAAITTGSFRTPDGTTLGCGVYLRNATRVSLKNMNLHDFTNFAIYGHTISGLSLDRIVTSGTNGDDVGQEEGAIRLVEFTGASGTSSFTNCTFGGNSMTHVVKVPNSSGTLNLTITSCTFTNPTLASGDDGLIFDCTTTATVTVKIETCTFTANKGDHFQAAASNSANINVTFKTNILNGGHPTALGGGVTINAATGVAFGGYTGTVNYDIDGNTINTPTSNAIIVNLGTSGAAGTFNGFIRNNVIGTVGAADSGSAQANGIAVDAHGNGTHTCSVTGNTIVQAFDRAISVLANDGNGVLNLTVQSNSLSVGTNPIGSREAFFLNNGSTTTNVFGLVDSHTVRLDFGGAGALANTIAHGVGAPDDFRIRQRFQSRIEMPGYNNGGNPFATASVVTYIQGRNTGSAGEPGSATSQDDAGTTNDGFYGGTVPLPGPVPQP